MSQTLYDLIGDLLNHREDITVGQHNRVKQIARAVDVDNAPRVSGDSRKTALDALCALSTDDVHFLLKLDKIPTGEVTGGKVVGDAE